LKRERWGSPLVQEKYLEEKACDKIHPYRIIIIIIIMDPPVTNRHVVTKGYICSGIYGGVKLYASAGFT